jgi:hypothetical protein
MHRHRESVYRAELDMGDARLDARQGLPLSRLETRLRYPMCDSREVTLIFSVPTNVQAATGARR